MISTTKPMQIQDLERIRSLMKELGYEASPTELEERFREITHDPRQAVFVAHIGDVRGFIHLELTRDLLAETKAHIKALVVSEPSRGQGIGQELIQQAREWARINGVSIIYLSCNIMRDRAHSFYLREGFKNYKTSHFFELEI